jgi:nitrate/nitrite transport system permease protein
MKKLQLDWLILPIIGFALAILVWHLLSKTVSKDLPSPGKTWEDSREYVLQPFAKRGEMDQGILRFTWYSLVLVGKGYALALLVGTPIGFMLGLSKAFAKAFDQSFRFFAHLAAGVAAARLVLFLSTGKQPRDWARFSPSPCARWPTVLNTAVGVRSVPLDYLNNGKSAEALSVENTVESPRASNATVHVHRLPPEPGHQRS